MNPIRVCMLTYSFPPIYSGAGAQALRLAQKLREKGVQTTILTARHSADLPAQETLEGVAVHRLPVSKAGRLRSLSFALVVAWHLLWHWRRYDVVHFHGAYWRIVPALWIARLTGRRVIVKMTQLGTDDPQTIRHRRLGTALLWTLAQAGAIVSTSRDLTASYEHSALPPDKLARIPNGVDVDVFRPADDHLRREVRARLDLPLADRLVVFVGRVGYRKGADILLRAWTRVAGADPDAWLVLVGPVGEDQAASADGPPIERILSDVPHTLPVGYRTDVQDYLRVADLFVFPSRMEGLPNALMEAMATALPCVASAVGGNTDLIVDGENGLLFEPGDVEQLASAIVRLLGDDGERDALGRRARETIDAGYSIDRVAERYVDLYGRLLEGAA